MEAVWVDEVFIGIPVLSIEYHSAEKPVLLSHHHSEEV